MRKYEAGPTGGNNALAGGLQDQISCREPAAQTGKSRGKLAGAATPRALLEAVAWPHAPTQEVLVVPTVAQPIGAGQGAGRDLPADRGKRVAGEPLGPERHQGKGGENGTWMACRQRMGGSAWPAAHGRQRMG